MNRKKTIGSRDNYKKVVIRWSESNDEHLQRIQAENELRYELKVYRQQKEILWAALERFEATRFPMRMEYGTKLIESNE